MLRTVIVILLLLAVAAVVYTKKDWIFSTVTCDSCGVPITQYASPRVIKSSTPTQKRSSRKLNPSSSDPRTINPSTSVAYVQFANPEIFGTFGLTDSKSPTFGDAEHDDMDDDAEYGLVKDGEIITNGRGCMPQKQLIGVNSSTVLPMRSLRPEPHVYDMVEKGLSSLHAGPVDLVDAKLTPPGMARPLSEWAFINYNSQ